jgi:protein phosphatase
MVGQKRHADPQKMNALEIETPACLNEVGGRENNEDSVYPAPGTAGVGDALFLVCDGVGGGEKGEIASRTLCQTLPEYFKAHAHAHTQTDLTFWQQAVHVAETQMQNMAAQDSACEGMASTLTLLHLQAKGAFVAWAGDSRVYHLRDGKILYRTEDHSLLNYLLKQGEITPEEAENYPFKNRILKAIGAANDATKISGTMLSDLKAGDFFLLCTDGLLEQWKDDELAALFHARAQPGDIVARLREKSAGRTQDNFSAYVVKLRDVPQTTVSLKKNDPPEEMTRLPDKIKWAAGLAVGLLIVLALIFWVAGGDEKNTPDVKKSINPSTQKKSTSRDTASSLPTPSPGADASSDSARVKAKANDNPNNDTKSQESVSAKSKKEKQDSNPKKRSSEAQKTSEEKKESKK